MHETRAEKRSTVNCPAAKPMSTPRSARGRSPIGRGVALVATFLTAGAMITPAPTAALDVDHCVLPTAKTAAVAGPSSDEHGAPYYEWSGSEWSPRDGKVTRLALNADGTTWAVNKGGAIFQRIGGMWAHMPGLATDIAVGGGEVWVLGTDKQPGGYGIYHWEKGSWRAIEGAGVAIAVGHDGMPWVVNDEQKIFERKNNTWKLHPGAARDIDAGGGAVWVIGNEKVKGGYGIYRFAGTDWQKVTGGGVRIAVSDAGDPWVVNDAGTIYEWSSCRGDWHAHPGKASEIAVRHSLAPAAPSGGVPPIQPGFFANLIARARGATTTASQPSGLFATLSAAVAKATPPDTERQKAASQPQRVDQAAVQAALQNGDVLSIAGAVELKAPKGAAPVFFFGAATPPIGNQAYGIQKLVKALRAMYPAGGALRLTGAKLAEPEENELAAVEGTVNVQEVLSALTTPPPGVPAPPGLKGLGEAINAVVMPLLSGAGVPNPTPTRIAVERDGTHAILALSINVFDGSREVGLFDAGPLSTKLHYQKGNVVVRLAEDGSPSFSFEFTGHAKVTSSNDWLHLKPAVITYDGPGEYTLGGAVTGACGSSYKSACDKSWNLFNRNLVYIRKGSIEVGMKGSVVKSVAGEMEDGRIFGTSGIAMNGRYKVTPESMDVLARIDNLNELLRSELTKVIDKVPGELVAQFVNVVLRNFAFIDYQATGDLAAKQPPKCVARFKFFGEDKSINTCTNSQLELASLIAKKLGDDPNFVRLFKNFLTNPIATMQALASVGTKSLSEVSSHVETAVSHAADEVGGAFKSGASEVGDALGLW